MLSVFVVFSFVVIVGPHLMMFLYLQLQITPGMLRRPYEMSEIYSGSLECKANALLAVLFLALIQSAFEDFAILYF